MTALAIAFAVLGPPVVAWWLAFEVGRSAGRRDVFRDLMKDLSNRGGPS